MNAQARLVRGLHGLRMSRPGIAIKNQIGDCVILQKGLQVCRPVFRLVCKWQVAALVTPEKPIARIEPDPKNTGPGFCELAGEAIEERPVRALQEQEIAPFAGGTAHGFPRFSAVLPVLAGKVMQNHACRL